MKGNGFSWLSAILLAMCGASAALGSTNVPVRVQFTGIMAFPPAGTNPLVVSIVDASDSGHGAYILWDPAVTNGPSSPANWTCGTVAGTTWKSCAFGNPHENLQLFLTTSNSLTAGPQFNCVVPIEDALGATFTPVWANVASFVTMPAGTYNATFQDTRTWQFSQICMRPAELVTHSTVASTVDAAHPIKIVSTAAGKAQLSFTAVNDPVGVELWIVNIPPDERTRVAQKGLHDTLLTNDHYLLYQRIVPPPPAAPAVVTPSVTNTCGSPVCEASLEATSAVKSAGRKTTSEKGKKSSKMKEQVFNEYGSNCPPVRLKSHHPLMTADSKP